MAKAKSGGGINSRVVIRPQMNGGSATVQKVSPGAVAGIGSMRGNHAQSGTVKLRPEPLVTGQAKAVPLGNAITKTMKPAVMRGGSQGRH